MPEPASRACEYYTAEDLYKEPTAAGQPEFDEEFEETRNALPGRAVNSFGHECWDLLEFSTGLPRRPKPLPPVSGSPPVFVWGDWASDPQ
eukprot:1487506-Pyramimonas_sp.AAC.1